MLAKRLRTLKHRAARWFLPPVRALHAEHQQQPAQEASELGSVRYAPRGVKPPASLQ